MTDASAMSDASEKTDEKAARPASSPRVTTVPAMRPVDAFVINKAAPAALSKVKSASSVLSSEIGTSEGVLAGHKDLPSAASHRRARRITGATLEEGSDEEEDGRTPGQKEDLGADWTYPDGGRDAWTAVLASYILAFTAMGVGFNWGVFQSYYLREIYPNVSPATMSLVQGVFAAFMNGTCFVAGRLGDVFGYRRMIAISIVGAFISTLVAAFSVNFAMMFVFQGALLGFTQGLGMPLYMAVPSQWFLKRRGLATGIAISGSGLGGAVSSLYLRVMIVKLGPRKTLIIYSFINLFMMCVGYSLLKIRMPPARPGEEGSKKPWFPKGCWTPTFFLLCFGVFVGTFGFLSPGTYINTYTQEKVPSIDPNSLLVAVPLIVMNLGVAIGRMIAGAVADFIGPVNALTFFMLLGGLFQCVIWVFADSFASIIAFAALFGMTGPSFLSLLAVAAAQLLGLRGLATTTGFLILMNAPGQFAGGPISGLVLVSTNHSWVAVAIFSGGTMLAGSLLILWARLREERRVFARF